MELTGSVAMAMSWVEAYMLWYWLATHWHVVAMAAQDGCAWGSGYMVVQKFCEA